MNSKQERRNKWQPRGGCNNSLMPLFIEGYFYFLNYPYLHRVYPLHWGKIDQLLGFRSDGHALHTKLLRLALRCDAMCRLRFPLEPSQPSFETQTQQKTVIRSAGWF
jgi:hypothetical protein